METQLRTFLLSKNIPMPNFTEISLTVWISIENIHTNILLYIKDVFIFNFVMDLDFK